MQSNIAADVSGGGLLVPFTRVGHADLWHLRSDGLAAQRLVVPKSNYYDFLAAFQRVKEWAKHQCEDLGPEPELLGATNVVEAFYQLYQDPTTTTTTMAAPPATGQGLGGFAEAKRSHQDDGGQDGEEQEINRETRKKRRRRKKKGKNKRGQVAPL